MNIQLGALRNLRTTGASGMHMLVIGIGYFIFALSLIFQSHRWHATPAYHNLLQIMPAPTWGVIFLITSVLQLGMAFLARPKALSYVAVFLGLMISSAWATAFVVRYLTNTSTTPETWVSWAIFIYLHVRAGFLIEKERGSASRAGGGT